MQHVGSVNMKAAPTQEACLPLKAYTGFPCCINHLAVDAKDDWLHFSVFTLKDSSCPTAPRALVLLIRETQHYPNKVDLLVHVVWISSRSAERCCEDILTTLMNSLGQGSNTCCHDLVLKCFMSFAPVSGVTFTQYVLTLNWIKGFFMEIFCSFVKILYVVLDNL